MHVLWHINQPAKGNNMTQFSFQALCAHYGIHPSVALENEAIVEALKARDDEAVERILKEEF